MLVDDRVAAVDGVPVETGTTEAAFAATIQKAPRPVTITFVRKSGVNVPVVDDDGWRDEAQTYPVPKFGLESEEVDALLRQWSADEQKRKYVRLWLDVVATSPTIPHKFPAGLTLASLEPAVKAGFAQLIVPLLRARGDVVLEVKSRPSPDRPGRVDLELRLGERAAAGPVRGRAAVAETGIARRLVALLRFDEGEDGPAQGDDHRPRGQDRRARLARHRQR